MKKHLLSTLLLFPALFWTSTEAQARTEPPHPDRAFIQTLIRDMALQKDKPTWPGFDITDYPVLYYDSHGNIRTTLLFNYPSSPPWNFVPIAGAAGVSESVTTTELPIPFDLYYPIGSKKALVAIRQFPFQAVFHEAFHRYQLTHSFYRENTGHNTHYQARDVVLAQREQRELAQALQSQDKNSLRLHIRRFVKLRNLRNQALPEQVVINENSLEAIEGTAAYVEHQFMLLTGKVTEKESRARLISQLTAPLDKNAMERGRYYLTGRAMGLLIDDMEYRWQKSATAGQTLIELISELSRYYRSASASEDANFIEETLLDPALIAQQKTIARKIQQYQQKKKAALVRFKNTKGHPVTIALSHDYSEITTSAENVLEVKENHTLFEDEAFVSYSGSKGAFLLMGPLMLIEGETGLSYRFYSQNMEQLTVNGTSVLSQGRCKTGKFAGSIKLVEGQTRFSLESGSLECLATGEIKISSSAAAFSDTPRPEP